MSTTPQVCAVIVTFNRKAMVCTSVAAILSQDHPVARLIIIDNASTDGTLEALKAEGHIDNPIVDYVRMDTNTGGAGGFHEGMKRALDTGSQWIWVMDDDVAADKTCLSQLLRYTSMSECIHPRRLWPDDSEVLWERQYDILTGGETALNNISFRNGKQFFTSNVACFEGMLVSSRVLREVGLPAPHYFIGEDDKLFGLKASFYTSIVCVQDAVLRKLIPPATKFPPAWKVYFWMRNSFYVFADITEFAHMRVSGGHRFSFILLRTLKLLGWCFRGPKYAGQAVKGYTHGLNYLFSGRKVQR